MANLQEKIAGLFPSATFEQEGDGKLRIVIPHDKLHSLVKDFRDNHRFDYLITIVGMDWKTSLGCIYYLTSSVSSEVIAVKTSTDDRDKPMLPSIADLYRIAEFYEREVYDFFGIIFVGNPDMRRLFLNIDWKGFPLRKDYDANPELNPVSIEAERQSDFTDQWVRTESGEVKCNRRRVFAEDDFVVNIGPQHPATHGVLRFRTAVDGETIKKIDVYMGYIHRGVEKLCEDLAYMQTLHFMDRLDYFSAHNYHHGLCLCIEKAAGIEVPRRAQVIRVMMDELMRISSHLLFMGTFCMDLGATTMLFYTLRERERILDIFEKTCGARMTFNYHCIGGVIDDLDKDFVDDVKKLLEIMPKAIKEYDTIFTGNVIAHNRMKGVGVLSKEDVISYGATGPVGRASGWACDVRKTAPYGIYSELQFDEITLPEGDSMARYLVRVEEIKQSCRILEQLVDNIPDGDICAKVPKIIKLPDGHWFQQVEASRGAFGVYIESHGDQKPWRVKFNSPCMNLAGIVPHAAEGGKIADLITIGGTFDYVVPDIDR